MKQINGYSRRHNQVGKGVFLDNIEPSFQIWLHLAVKKNKREENELTYVKMFTKKMSKVSYGVINLQ